MGIENKAAILYITDNGFALARKLNSLYPYAKVFKFKPDTLSKFWGKRKNFIFIMASGIVVRTIAPLLKDKRTDPAVVVLDEKGKFSVSLLSGHLGGANKIAKEIADFLNSKRGLVGETKSHPRTEAVITTASDINGLPAIDLWAKENDLVIEKWETVSKISTRFLNSGELKVYSEVEIKMPEGFLRTDKPSSADVLVTNKKGRFTDSPIHRFTGLYLRPRNLIIGVGCNKGTSANEIENSVKTVLDENNLSFLSIHSIAAIDIKANEPGLITFAQKYNLGIKTFSANELNTLISRQPSAISFSKAAFKATGAYAVAEPSALLASGADKLLVRKQKIGNVTVAIAECGLRNDINATNAPSHPPLKLRGGRGSYECGKIRNPKSEITPKLYIVGTGPGSIVHITPYAQNAIRNSDVIVGYGTYIELIKELIKDKAIVSTGMTQEIDRCKKAVELAISGRTVSIISGGDPGIYAMAGLVFEMLKNETKKQRSGEMETKEQHRTETSPIHRFTDSPPVELGLASRWILSRLAGTAEEINAALEEYRFNDAANSIYHFIWHEFCDWYIEMSKTEISSQKSTAGVIHLLLYTLETSLKLLHPFMPFVTEEIWQSIKQLSSASGGVSYQLKAKSIVIAEYPQSLPRDLQAEREMSYVIEAITGIRTVRSELNISPSVEVNVLIKTFSCEASDILRANLHYIKKLSRTADVTIGEDIKKPADSAVCVKDSMEVYIPIKGLLNIDAEIDKLIKESRKVEETMAFIDRKLMNEDFLKKAPKDVVEKEKAKHSELAAKKQRIKENINKLKASA